MFESVFQEGTLAAGNFFFVIAVSLLCGTAFALLCCFRAKTSKSFFAATSLLPMSVAVVIALVNGNLGVGVAVAGAFGLVRFRSAPGSAREISVIFIAMAAGLAFGMGYLLYGAIFLLICGIILLLFQLFFSEEQQKSKEKLLKITIPENLDYTAVFEDIFAAYTDTAELEQVKSTNMGSMFRLTYRVKLKDSGKEKELLDALRTRNGNLEILCSRADLSVNEL